MAASRLSRHSVRSEETQGRPAGPNRFAIVHVSHYRYSSPAQRSILSLCLRPRDTVRQQLLHFDLTTDPFAYYSPGTDPYGNTKHVLSMHERHDSLKITARTMVETGPVPHLPRNLEPGAWDKIHAWRDSFALWDYTHDSPLAHASPALASFIARENIEPADDPLQAVGMLSEKLHRVFDYVPGSTSAASSIDEILESGRGVCQDYAHVMIAIARSWGVPARYVSGYVHVAGESREHAQAALQTSTSAQRQTSTPYHTQASSQTQRSTDTPTSSPVLTASQASTSSPAPQTATHAWVECRLPGLGWVGFDPTNQTLAGDHHVTIAVGRDYQDVAPSKGILHGFVGAILEVDVRMRLLPPVQTESA